MNPSPEVSFKLRARELLAPLRIIRNANTKHFSGVLISLTILQNAIELKGIGINHKIVAETGGIAAVSVPAALIWNYIQHATGYITFIFKNGSLICGSSTYTSNDIKLRPFELVRDNPLPVNPVDFNILVIGARESRESMEAFKITHQYDEAEHRLKLALNKATKLLKEYQVTRSELEGLIRKKIKDAI